MNHIETLRAALIEIRDLSDDFESRHMAVEALAATAEPEAARTLSRKDVQDTLLALTDLHATVWGECPSLLDEDSGGSSVLDMDIRDVIKMLTAAVTAPAVQGSAPKMTDEEIARVISGPFARCVTPSDKTLEIARRIEAYLLTDRQLGEQND